MNHYYHTIQGYFTFSKLYSDMAKKFGNNSHFVEVGSWKGRSAVYMGVEIINSEKNIKFDCIDFWGYKYGDSVYSIFLNNIKPLNGIVNHYRMLSVDASKLYEDNSLDFVFIDASHKYADVLDDIKHWYPKIKNGGVIAGHDYYMTDVKTAVDEYFLNRKIDFDVDGISWIYNKI